MYPLMCVYFCHLYADFILNMDQFVFILYMLFFSFKMLQTDFNRCIFIVTVICKIPRALINECTVKPVLNSYSASRDN